MRKSVKEASAQTIVAGANVVERENYIWVTCDSKAVAETMLKQHNLTVTSTYQRTGGSGKTVWVNQVFRCLSPVASKPVHIAYRLSDAEAKSTAVVF